MKTDCEHCPQFRDVKEGLTSLEEKVDSLIETHSNMKTSLAIIVERLSPLPRKVASLEKDRYIAVGFIAAISVLWAIVKVLV